MHSGYDRKMAAMSYSKSPMHVPQEMTAKMRYLDDLTAIPKKLQLLGLQLRDGHRAGQTRERT
jgi:hypothetical protein